MSKNPASVVLGPVLIGYIGHLLLFGVVLTQLYIYMVTYRRRDKLWMKVYVSALAVANIINTVLLSMYVYTTCIDFFGDVEYIESANWMFASEVAMTGIIAATVQGFFAWRVRILTGSVWLALGVLSVTLASAGGAFATTVEVGLHPRFVEFQSFQGVVIVWLVCACVADLFITGILVWHLRTHKTGFQGSDELIDRIIRDTVQTGMLTSVFAIIDLILFLIFPDGLHLIFNLPLAKLYTNSLMSSLNSRSGWQYSESGPSHSQHVTGGLNITSQSNSAARKKNDIVRLGASRPEVFVHVEQHELQDVPSGEGITYGVEDLGKNDARDYEGSSQSQWTDSIKRDAIV